MKRIFSSIWIPDFIYNAIPIVAVAGGAAILIFVDCDVTKVAGLGAVLYGGYIFTVRL